MMINVSSPGLVTYIVLQISAIGSQYLGEFMFVFLLWTV